VVVAPGATHLLCLFQDYKIVYAVSLQLNGQTDAGKSTTDNDAFVGVGERHRLNTRNGTADFHNETTVGMLAD
jgi:hypothetical protein